MGVYSHVELKEITDILAYYELGEVASFRATAEGISNSNYQVIMKSGLEVLLKISNDKTIPQLENEQRILQVLKKYKYDYSPRAFETIAGKPIYTHKDFYGVVFPFIKGEAPKVATKSILSQMGETLAKLHTLEIHAEDLDLIRPHDLVGFGGMNIYDYTIQKDAAKDFCDAFNRTFPNKLLDLPYDIFPAGIIHGDLYLDNSLFQNDKLQTFIDFEQAGRGRFILDLGIAISGSCLDSSRESVDLAFMKDFIAGYETHRKMLAIEKEYLNVAVLVGFFSIALWRIKRFYEGNLDESKKFNYRELLERARVFEARVGLAAKS